MFTEVIDNLFTLYEDTQPKIIKRVYRIKGKRRYRKMIKINFMHDMLGFKLRQIIRMIKLTTKQNIRI